MLSRYSTTQIQSAVAALKSHKEESYVSHEWGELILRLSHDNDPKLREKMFREMDEVLAKDSGFKIFKTTLR